MTAGKITVRSLEKAGPAGHGAPGADPGRSTGGWLGRAWDEVWEVEALRAISPHPQVSRR